MKTDLRLLPLSFLSLAAASAALAHDAQPALDAISADRIRTHVETLSSDKFEGRAPASQGEELTVAYLAAEFEKAGLEPGNPDGTWFQPVPMIGIKTTLDTTIRAGSETFAPVPINDYNARSRRSAPEISVKDSELIFVGYGVQAPEFGWDDFKGVDVRGKTLVVLINDPAIPDPANPSRLDDSIFKGNAMTYYGRWSYKYEKAAELGAAACLIIHETGPAGYPFAVVGARYGFEEFELPSPDGNAGRAAVEGWLTLDFARKLLAATGHDFDELKRRAINRDFQPVPLGATASFDVRNVTREVASQNVVARLPGSDPAVRDEHIVYTAHWDHLGVDPRLPGDQIYNGAADNASGTAVLLELARAFKQLPSAPRRSVVFLAVTAEEKGLLGSRYYSENPLYPLRRNLANINMDVAQVYGRSRDVEVVGYGNSTIDDIAARILARNGRTLVPDTNPDKGYYYRSDHFNFAKKGVPAFYMKYGKDIIGRPDGYGQERLEHYTARDYHKVSDEIKEYWDFAGTVEDARFLLELGFDIANGDTWPEWKPGTEFKAARDAQMAAD